jgi:hypothetical protein
VKDWCIPETSATFVANMANVLDVYEQPYNPLEPVVCFDESSKQRIDKVRSPSRLQPNQVARRDSEYQRKGTANLFMCFEPLTGWRHTAITDRRTRQDFAH